MIEEEMELNSDARPMSYVPWPGASLPARLETSFCSAPPNLKLPRCFAVLLFSLKTYH
jgi:hypothetical protein